MAAVELGPGSGFDGGPNSGPDSGPDSDPLEIRNVGGIRAILSILFLSSDVYRYPCGVHNPYGTRNTWCCHLWQGPTSFELATSGTARFVLHVGPVTLRLLGE